MYDLFIQKKASDFADRGVKLSKHLREKKKEFTISDQILRSSNSIRANIKEARFAQSKADFIHKLQIALKEASETQGWIESLKAGEYVDERGYNSLKADIDEIIKMLVASIKKLKH